MVDHKTFSARKFYHCGIQMYNDPVFGPMTLHMLISAFIA